MGTRSLLNLALVAILIVLGLVVYYKPGLEPEPVAQRLTTHPDPHTAAAIHIDRLTRDPLEFIRRGDRWYLVHGEQELPASGFQVQALLRLLEAASTRHYPAADLDLKALGLDPPQATLTIDDVAIRFGNTEPLENNRYALVDGTVHLISDQYQHLMNSDWANFVERRLLPAGKTLRSLQLPDMTLTLTDENRWQLSPGRPDIGADAIQQVVDSWQNASALYVRPFKGSQSGEAVTLELSGMPEPLTFRILSRSPELVLARPDQGIEYHFTADMEKGLLSLPETPAEQ